MWPVITQFEVLGRTFTIHTFGLFVVLAFLASAAYVRRRASRDLGLDKEWVFNICFVLLIVAVIGARLLYVSIHHSEFAKRAFSFLFIWEGGFAFYGGLFACLIAVAWYLPRHPKLQGFAFLDILALGACLAIFVGRWASFLSGESYGKEAPDLPWALRFPPEGQARPSDVPLHPTQLYHSLHGLLLFIVLWWTMRRRPFPGRTLGLFLMLYAVGRIIIEIWRGDDATRGMVFDSYVSIHQVLSVPVFFAGLAIFLIRRPTEDSPYGP